MTIEDLSYTDIYLDHLDDMQFLDDLSVEWRGRNVVDAQDELALKMINVFSRIYLQIAHTNPKKFPSLNDQTFLIDPDSSVRIYRNEPVEPKKFEIAGKKVARGRIGGINGMGNNLEEAKNNARYLSQLSQNHHLEWVHNCSHTILVDALESVLLNYHGISAPAQFLQENWRKFHDDYKNDLDAKYLQFCHSQGAIHVRNALLKAPKEIRDRVIVVAIAPATVVPKNLCFDSFNYASKRDPIPYGEAGFKYDADASYEEREAEPSRVALKELILLEPHPSAHFFDHDFESPTFQTLISHHIKKYTNEYGIQK